MRYFNTIIIGGGASGLSAAITAQNKSVAILEAYPRIGKKILATGNGKCNLCNINIDASLYNDAEFVTPIFQKYDSNFLLNFFHELGLYTRVDNEGRIYPFSETASSVLDVLRKRIDSLEIKVYCDTKVIEILKSNNYTKSDNFNVKTDKGDFSCKNLIFACGSNATFGHDSLYLLKDYVNIIKAKPSLVPIKTDTKFIKGLSGVRIKCNASLIIDNRIIASESGEILFKDFGVSGIVAFNLSAYLARQNHYNNAKISLNLLSMDKKQTYNYIYDRFKKFGNLTIENFFVGVFHKMVVKNLAEISNFKLNEKIDKRKLNILAENICNFQLEVKGLGNLSQAQVLSGGVDTKDINPVTLEAKNVKNLYIIGEALNVDGVCGGYNLAWAWASGICAGEQCK